MKRAIQESLLQLVCARGSTRGLWIYGCLLLVLLGIGSCQDRESGTSCVDHPEICSSGQSCNPLSQACEPAPAATLVLTGISPALGPTSGGVTLELSGQRFLAGATVSIDGVAATQVSVMSETQLVATLPARPGAHGLVPVVVQNPNGQEASRSDLFAYFAGWLAFPEPRFPVGTNPFSVTVGDFNADGKADLAVANSGSGNVGVLLGDGKGGFAAQVPFAVGTAPRSVAVGDFNADGKADLAVANNGSNTVSVLLGDGKGAFAAQVPFAAGTAPNSVVVGDA